MISDFIYKYYIDPIRYEQPYNTVDTITYALILVSGRIFVLSMDVAIDLAF